MKRFLAETWDDGRLLVNPNFVSMMRRNGLDSFEKCLNRPDLTEAKNLRKDRITSRFEMTNANGGQESYFLKWHGRAPLKDYIKPVLQLKRPIVGAWNEWLAMHQFAENGIPSMVPVAFGAHESQSFVISKGGENCQKLSELANENMDRLSEEKWQDVFRRLGMMTRKMHDAGLYHQDYYLGHLLLPDDENDQRIFVIDLGRAGHSRNLSMRWIVKDLSQLVYSSREIPAACLQEFWDVYFADETESRRTTILDRIDRKTASIASHSRKNRL